MTTDGQLRRVGVLTAGGDCPGLNAVIRAFVKTAIAHYDWEILGILDGFELSRDECEAIIMQARLKAGWITEADLAKEAAEEAAEPETAGA